MIGFRVEAISKEIVDAWFAEWEALEARIHAAHDARNGEAKALMEEAIVLFERLLIDSADGGVSGRELDPSATYEVMPINGAERLAFIKTKPGQYACYRQLDELFKETKKRTARLRLQAAKQ